MKRLIALALLMGSAQLSAQTVESAEGDWSAVPRADAGSFANIGAAAVSRIHDIVISGECTLPGQSKRRLNMSVPILLHYEPDGTLRKLVVRKIGCAEIEGLLGGAVLELVQAGKFKPTGANADGWYRSEVNFSSRISPY